MKAISRAIDKFCLKHSRFGVPRLMQYIVFITGAVFIADKLIGVMPASGSLQALIAFHPGLIARGEVWRITTWVFLPRNGDIFFTAIMLYFYYFVGSTLEQVWGAPKFTIFYLFGVLLNIVYGFVLWFVLGNAVEREWLFYFWSAMVKIDPMYLNLSLYFAFATIFPNNVVRLFFLIPIKIKWMALANAAFFVYSIVINALGGNYAAFLPLIALFNYILICGYDLLNNLRPASVHTSRQAINFKRAARSASREINGKNYRHKCAVCGKTDTEHPELEFRYCSRCEGYHCFCIEHINNHVHFR